MTSLLGKHRRANSDPTEMPPAKKPKPAPLQSHPAAEDSVPSESLTADDAGPPTGSTGFLLRTSQEFAQRPLVLYAGKGREQFFVHKHLIPPKVIRAMRSFQVEDVTEIHLEDEEPDVVGLMVRWCYRSELPNITEPAVPKPQRDLRNTPESSTPRKGLMETGPDQYNMIKLEYRACKFDGVWKIVSFEEKRLDDYKTSASIRSYLQDAEGMPMGKSNLQVMQEHLQIKLVRLSNMASKYGWKRLLDSTLFAYAKGEMVLKRRCPISRHIELVYSAGSGLPPLRTFMSAYAATFSQRHNTRAELVPLFEKYPAFLLDFMTYQDSICKDHIDLPCPLVSKNSSIHGTKSS
ncbi:hypothetical protein LX36DRAFT_726633 [Colletotrichum falcatum]|nr:hypothetical protein LX36DRAFT_726633 [Colletotrichum falcatum]